MSVYAVRRFPRDGRRYPLRAASARSLTEPEQTEGGFAEVATNQQVNPPTGVFGTHRVAVMTGLIVL